MVWAFDFAVAEGEHIGFERELPAGDDLGQDDHDIVVGQETAGRYCNRFFRQLAYQFGELGLPRYVPLTVLLRGGRDLDEPVAARVQASHRAVNPH